MQELNVHHFYENVVWKSSIMSIDYMLTQKEKIVVIVLDLQYNFNECFLMHQVCCADLVQMTAVPETMLYIYVVIWIAFSKMYPAEKTPLKYTCKHDGHLELLCKAWLSILLLPFLVQQ